MRRLAFYRALRLKGHHICRKVCSRNDAELTGGLCALEDSCLQVWAGRLTAAQSGYESPTAKSEHLLPGNTMRWWSYFSPKVSSPWAGLSASINPCNITQWKEWGYTNLHWHSIWLLGPWEAEVLSFFPWIACVQLPGYLLYPSYSNLWPETVVLAQPASCTSVSLQVILGWFCPVSFKWVKPCSFWHFLWQAALQSATLRSSEIYPESQTKFSYSFSQPYVHESV